MPLRPPRRRLAALALAKDRLPGVRSRRPRLLRQFHDHPDLHRLGHLGPGPVYVLLEVRKPLVELAGADDPRQLHRDEVLVIRLRPAHLAGIEPGPPVAEHLAGPHRRGP